jgi:hypothetical protein
MTDLFDIPEQTPPWKVLADERGIATEFYDESWTASIEWWGDTETETAETEKLAIEALTLRLKLNEKGNDEQN